MNRKVITYILFSVILGFSCPATAMGRDFESLVQKPPRRVPAHMANLIGRYGSEENYFLILERNGSMFLNREGSKDVLLTRIQEDLYQAGDGRKIEFAGFSRGVPRRCLVEGVEYPRWFYGTEGGETFRIKPVRPVEELRTLAMKATPPPQGNGQGKPHLVEPVHLDPSIVLDIRYATDDNFMGEAFYSSPRAYLQEPAAQALARVQKRLKPHGFGIMIYDAYRPWYVTKMFWDATPQAQKKFVANPANGSRHNRGTAVDVTLIDLESGKPVEMTGGFDEFTHRSYPDFPGGTSRQRWHRDILRLAMESEGFTVYPYEWWHFDYGNWKEYPVMNDSFEELDRNYSAR